MTLTLIYLILFKGYFLTIQKIPANFIEILLVPETSSKLTFHSLVTWARISQKSNTGCSVSLGVAFPKVLIGKEALSSNKFISKRMSWSFFVKCHVKVHYKFLKQVMQLKNVKVSESLILVLKSHYIICIFLLYFNK